LYLIANSQAAAIGTDIFLDTRPDQPDNLISIFEYAGLPTTTGVDALDRRVQVLVRNKSYATARAKAWAIFNLLDRADTRGEGVQLTPDRVAIIQALQTPFKLETDASGRTVFVFNLAVATTRD
jgi:hypothetical protein